MLSIALNLAFSEMCLALHLLSYVNIYKPPIKISRLFLFRIALQINPVYSSLAPSNKSFSILVSSGCAAQWLYTHQEENLLHSVTYYDKQTNHEGY
jgi:hypothetical protein